MPRTYSENSEPRKVYQADTIRGFTEDEVKDSLNKAQTSDQFIIPESANITLSGDDVTTLISTGSLSNIDITGISDDYIPKFITVSLTDDIAIANISAVRNGVLYDFMYYIDALHKTAYVFAAINSSDLTKANIFLHILD